MAVKQFFKSEFQHHHAFILIIAAIALFFFGNIFAYNYLENTVNDNEVLSSNQSPVIVARADKEDQPAEINNINSLEREQPLLDEFVENAPVTTAVWLQDMETGDWIGVNESVTFDAASLYKLFVTFETYKQVDLEIHSESTVLDTEDGPRSIDYCLEVAITVSDNNCGRELRRLVQAHIEPLPSLADAGFFGTSLTNDYPTTSARDVALLLQKLYHQNDLTPESNEEFLNNLKSQEIDNRIPAGLPDSAIVAHKTGDLEGYAHDGGILYTEKGDFILVVLSGPWDNGYSDAPPYIADFVSKLYDQL